MKSIAVFEVYVQILLLMAVICSIFSFNNGRYIIIVPSLFITVLYGILLAYKLKTDKCGFQSDKKPGAIRLYSLLGGIAGVFIAKTLLDKEGQNKAVTVLLICLILYSCFIGISALTVIVKAYLILHMTDDALILYATYLLKCAKAKPSLKSSQCIEQAVLIIKNSSLSCRVKDELLCGIENSNEV